MDFKKELNEQQWSAVTSEARQLLVLAGAGSGKTKVLTHRVAFMIEKLSVPAEGIILLTFTNKAAGEMKERVIAICNRAPGFAGTFHSYCARILRIYGKEIGIDEDFVIYDEDDKQSAIKMAMKEAGIVDKKIKPASIGGAISNAKNEMISPTEYASMAKGEFMERIARVYTGYEQTLRKHHALDFDDLLVWGVRLLESPVGTRIKAKIGSVLIDEYQDTNTVQYRLTKQLIEGGKYLTVVGDFSQSIYSWRGANFTNLLQIERDYPEIEKIQLKINYRSTQRILDAAFGVIGNNQMHPVLKLEAVAETGEKVGVYEAFNEKDEAKYVAETVLEAQRVGSVAVLYRTNAQSRVLEEEFLRRGMKYTLVGGVKFYERREVKDVLSYLKVVFNTHDQVAWERIDKVGKRRRRSFEMWLESIKLSGKEVKSMSTQDVLTGILQSTEYLSLYDENDENDLMRLENIKELASVAAEFTDLSAFLENVALVQSEMTVNLGEDDVKGVTLMTIHAAKGLEFDTVILIGMEEGLFPHSRSLMDRDQMEEERRLCYVAITRAKKKLNISWAKSRMYFGTTSSGTTSRFVSEIPGELLDGRVGNKSKGERRMVPDWDLNEALADDFAEVDSW